IITRATPDNLNLQFKEKTILDAFQEAGFYTAWISNQNAQQPIIKRLKEVADYSYFSKSEIDNNSPYDTDLIPNIKQALQNRSKRKFIIIHTLGSHFRYSKRYPKSFEKFTPAIAKTGYENFDISNKTKFINAYDNSILFTDFFLHSLIKELEKINVISTLMYISDHGENLFDDKNELILHGTESPTKHEYHIPLFMWFSKGYQEKNTEKVNNLINNKDKKATSNSTFYTLLDIANIRYNSYEKEIHKSLSNINYREPIERKLINTSKKVIVTK
ncbi:phosphoethanolamine transferase, partial [Pseudopedobacter sp.]|uniref:phosphoethanolamine transferase n=1 Tax=Pseudopedobacter sp. TaxID=1936787 RepID=UPI00333FB642